jgi:membrane-associated phospholipid phosphatase
MMDIQMNKTIPLSFWMALMFCVPATAQSAPSTLIQNTWNDGVYLYTSPLRLEKSDVPMLLAVSGLLGGSLALDGITRRNLAFYQDSHSASLLRHYGDYAQFGGLMASGVFAVTGWTTHDDHEKQVSWDLIESFFLANAITGTFKVALGRRRPDATTDPFELRPVDVNSSFPSGHTTSAFAAATTLSEYYPVWTVVVPAYAAASAVAFSRLYANQHWGSDVVGGALVGFGVSHTLYKRHHQRPDSSWDFRLSPDGFAVSRKF